MTQTIDHDIDPSLGEPAAQPVRYIHTRWPSPAQMTANAAVAAMALIAFGLFTGGFTGHVDMESPVVPAALVLLYALAWVALRARQRAVRHAATVKEQP